MTVADPPDADALGAALAEARRQVSFASRTEWVTETVRERIVEGLLKPGERVPEHMICVELKVSRNTVREAMSQLVADRVLVREAHRGMFVARPGKADIRDVYRARRVIETGVVRDLETVDPARLAAVRVAVDEGRAALEEGEWHDLASANQHFHRALVALAGSRRLDQQMGLLLAEMRLVFHGMSGVREFHEPYLGRNADICELLEKGELAAAADAVAAYLDEAEQHLLAGYPD